MFNQVCPVSGGCPAGSCIQEDLFDRKHVWGISTAILLTKMHPFPVTESASTIWDLVTMVIAPVRCKPPIKLFFCRKISKGIQQSIEKLPEPSTFLPPFTILHRPRISACHLELNNTHCATPRINRNWLLVRRICAPLHALNHGAARQTDATDRRVVKSKKIRN